MHEFDLIFVGAGLVNSISYFMLSQLYPDRKFLLIEQGDSIGGHRTWSFHAHEITAAAEEFGFEPAEIFRLLQPFIAAQWSDYEVRFDHGRQIVPLGYCCMRSGGVHAAIMASCSSGVILNSKVDILNATSVRVAGLGELRARAIIDGRGLQASSDGPMAFQKFYGIFLKTAPHGAWARPVLMDATIEQDGDFRFIYVLPFGAGRALVEDTRFSSSAVQDPLKSRAFIQRWLHEQGIDHYEVEGEEAGCLPIPLLGMKRPTIVDPWPVVGYRAGLFNASTGYSFSYALRTALWLADEGLLLSVDGMRRWLVKFAANVWEQNEFNRRLNNMMIKAIEPERRREIFSRFYRLLPPAVIARFYSGELNLSDKFRILNIRPNISWPLAAKSFMLPSLSVQPRGSDASKEWR